MLNKRLYSSEIDRDHPLVRKLFYYAFVSPFFSVCNLQAHYQIAIILRYSAHTKLRKTIKTIKTEHITHKRE